MSADIELSTEESQTAEDDENEALRTELREYLAVDEVDLSDITRTGDGETVHEPTGIIVDDVVGNDRIDRGPEWRAFNHTEQQSKSRVGSPTTMTRHDKGLTTNIDWRNKDSNGNNLSAEKRYQMRRLRTWQERIRTQDASERNLKFALSEMDRMASALGVPKSVREVAAMIYRRVLDADLIRGRSIEGCSSAALYAGCRIEGVPRSLDAVSHVSRVDRTELGRTYRYISQELSLPMEPVNPNAYVPRFCSDLNLSPEVEHMAKEVLEKSERMSYGKAPTGLAAASIYVASLLLNEKATQAEIAEVADVTEVTIRNRYQDMVDEIGIPSGSC